MRILKAIISENKLIITLPIPLESAVFTVEYNQHDGYYVELKEYTTGLINKEVFLTRHEAEKFIKENEKD